MSAFFLPKYIDSHALVVGIDRYKRASPLAFAVADANSVAQALIDVVGFPRANVRVLTNAKATRVNICRALLNFTRSGSGPDDRVVFFFAGHGHTEPSPHARETGYLVPVDGTADDLSTCIRWEEIIGLAELIPAKHVLFLMDACYGGLAVKRLVTPGTMRLAQDMLSRSSRQVLSAGKADQVVDDCGGPIPGHSPFTGYLLEGLAGKAAGPQGVITANGLMHYVYHSVGTDPLAAQTPHYGQVSGDGDMILVGPVELLDGSGVNEKTGADTFVSIPSTTDSHTAGATKSSVDEIKLHLGGTHVVKVFDIVADETRRVVGASGQDVFPTSGHWTSEEFRSRLERYEELLGPLPSIQALLGGWASPQQGTCLLLALKRLVDQNRQVSGNTGFLALRWHPALVLFYATGIAAVASERYDNLGALFTATSVSSETDRWGRPVEMLIAVSRGGAGVDDMFKTLPGLERRYLPRNDYLFSRLQPVLDDALFLGSDYEEAFDRFEMLATLQSLHVNESRLNSSSFPFGRFAWKVTSGHSTIFANLKQKPDGSRRSGRSWRRVSSMEAWTGSIGLTLRLNSEYPVWDGGERRLNRVRICANTSARSALF